MSANASETRSLWMESERPRYAPLARNEKADVCVIGAGIAGLTTAYLLAREGRSVLVLEASEIGSGETERTTAHLASALDDRFTELERLHGADGARLAARSHHEAIGTIERIAGEEGIACDFMRCDGWLFNPPGSKRLDLEEELAAARRVGLDVELAGRAPLGTFDTGPALRYAGQGQFHPMKYLAGLADAFVRRGGRICTHTRAKEIEGGANASVGTRAGQRVSCGAIVVATNTPVNDRLVMHTKRAPYRTYVIGIAVPADSVTRALYWDTAEPYHYVRLLGAPANAAEDVLIVGGEDHRTGQLEDTTRPFRRLEQWTRERFAVRGEVQWRWSGQVLEPVDGLAFIGRNPLDEDNVYIATGDSGHGMTHGTIAGLLLTDLIAKRDNPWAALYDPSRKPLRAGGEYVKESANMAAQYLDWLTAGDVEKERLIAPGHGAVVRHGFAKVAVYRDDGGRFHEMSAMCPHLGAIVHWNAAENTWDCPAHGSRFTCRGAVLNGPANVGLETLRG